RRARAREERVLGLELAAAQPGPTGATRIGERAGGDARDAVAAGLSLPAPRPRAGVGDLDVRGGDGLAAVERRHPDERRRAAPFEVDGEVGDERGGRDVAGAAVAEERRAEARARELDDVEAGLLERDPDDLEGASARGLRHLEGPHARRVGRK